MSSLNALAQFVFTMRHRWLANPTCDSSEVGNTAGRRLTGCGADRVSAPPAELAQARKDLEIVEELKAIRLRRSVNGPDGRMYVTFGNGTDGAFAKAYRAYGIDILVGSAESAGARIADSSVKEALLAGLDEWAITDREPRGRILAVARAADDDPLRRRLRDPALWDNKKMLLAMAREADHESLAPSTLISLCSRLRAVGEQRQAAELLISAARRFPRDFWVQFDLGTLLDDDSLKQPEEAISYYRAAISARPDIEVPHNNLGVLLQDTNRLKEAEAEFRKAIELDPKDAMAHTNLGDLLRNTNRPEEAEAEFRKGVEIDPKLAATHNNLGVLLKATNRLKEAEGEYRQAIELDPNLVNVHNNLGNLLTATNRLKEAETEFRKAIAVHPQDVPAHLALGVLLMRKMDRFAEAVTILKHGRALADGSPRLHASRLLAQAERLLALDRTLSAIRSGRSRPGNAVEALDVARFALVRKHQPRIAARLFQSGLADKSVPRPLRIRYEYVAACAAVLCAGGKVEKDARPPDAEESARLRQQALEWLNANLADRQRLMKVNAKNRAAGLRVLRHWRTNPDLAAVRGEAIDRLPESERGGWRQLWTGVRAVIRSQPVTAPRPRSSWYKDKSVQSPHKALLRPAAASR